MGFRDSGLNLTSSDNESIVFAIRLTLVKICIEAIAILVQIRRRVCGEHDAFYRVRKKETSSGAFQFKNWEVGG